MLFDTLTELDRLGRNLSSVAGGAISAPVDIHRDGDRYVVDADLPGVDPSSVEVTLEGQALTIRAERSEASTTKDAQWVVHERGSWSCLRRFTLGEDIDPDGITADYRDGVLTVVVPIRKGRRPHKVPIAIGSDERPAVTGSTAADSEGTKEGKARAAHSQAS